MRSQIRIQLFTTILCLFTLPINAQQKFSIDNIFVKGEFKAKEFTSIKWMNDSKNYTALIDNQIIKFNTQTGAQEAVLFDGEKYEVTLDKYSLSQDEKKLLIAADREDIYRRSFKANYFIFDLTTNKIQKVSDDGPQQYATFSPDGLKVAYVKDNDLYFVDLRTEKVTQVSRNGEINKIINGTTDWVYEEEFGFVKGFQWSPKSDKIAYYSFDESKVKEFQMQVWDSLYPQFHTFKYPKAGEDNSRIALKIYHINDRRTVNVNLGDEKDIYIPRMQWTKNNDLLSFIRLNRFQNKFEILHAGANSGMSQIELIELYGKNYFDINFCDDLSYLKKKFFIYTTEQKGFKHLYAFDYEEKKLTAITEGDWEIDEVVGIDEKSKTVYFTSTEKSHLERHLFKIGFNGKDKKQLTSAEGWHKINMSPDCKFFIDEYSAPGLAPSYTLHDGNGKKIKVLEDNAPLNAKVKSYEWNPKEFTTLKISDSVELHGYIIKPSNFDASKKYPLMMFLYGGPGSQMVKKEWDGNTRELYHKMLAQKGFVIACFDNRGTGGRGAQFKKVTYKQLGKYETEDQIAVAKALGKESWIDENRIGIWGWSYGGFMSTSCLFKGNDVFSLAIAVAPVSNWRYYDNIYTERYMRRPKDNPKGYDENSPINFVDQLKGDYLLIHGTGDDNVHLQNAIELQKELLKLDKDFDAFHYPNSNHGISTYGVRPHLYRKMMRFIIDRL